MSQGRDHLNNPDPPETDDSLSFITEKLVREIKEQQKEIGKLLPKLRQLGLVLPEDNPSCALARCSIAQILSIQLLGDIMIKHIES